MKGKNRLVCVFHTPVFLFLVLLCVQVPKLIIIDKNAVFKDPLPIVKRKFERKAESMPWRVYDAFLRKHDACSTVTIVAQFEGYCDDMLQVLSSAAEASFSGNTTAWLESAVARPKECAVCVLNDWEKRERPRVESLKRKRLKDLGFPATSNLRCIFQSNESLSTIAKSPDPAFVRSLSTLVIECPVPIELQSQACDSFNTKQLTLEIQKNFDDVPLRKLSTSKLALSLVNKKPHFLTNEESHPTVAACTWVSTSSFRDRGGKKKIVDLELMREWLAAHRVMGVSYFAIFESDADWTADNFRQSVLWPVLAPLIRENMATLIPWPLPACGTRGDGPWVKLKGSQRTALSVQDFFGRPAQYAAQNSCHRRLFGIVDYVLHIDIDEYAIPGIDHKNLASVLRSTQSRIAPYPLGSLALPHIFYGRCPETINNASSSSLFFPLARGCAGKAQPSRIKQLASTEHVSYIWDHYIRAKTPQSRTLNANALREARLAHARADYGYNGPATARFAPVATDERASPKAWRTFRHSILPRLYSLNCNLANDTSLCGVDDSFCWCRDIATIEYWADRVKKQYHLWWSSYENAFS
mmetsp:Transcript_7273/g.10857  ORF Transcript_7273/g.10857 Transcript_7273/m.10857 type:complete len:584 (-) Transcript_7273:372-2123(-)